MKLTNNYKLPQTLVNLHNLQREEYDKGEARMSVTQLMRPPQIDILQKRHWEEMTDDISDRLWAVLGTVIHSVMERGGDEEHVLEERLFTEIDGWIISGGIDVQRIGDRAKLIDYKFTKAIKFQIGDFKDWEQQLNSYAYLVNEVKGWEIEGLEICMFVRDWTASIAKTRSDYPPAPCVPVPVTLWPKSKQKDFLRERVKEHRNALRAVAWGESIPPCTDEERWKRASDWAVMKGDNKRASRVFESEQKAADWVANLPVDPKVAYYITERHDTPTRCKDNYCGVNAWCQQWQSEKEKYANV